MNYDWMNADEWANYSMTRTTAYTMLAYGGLLAFIGFAWSVSAMGAAVVETEQGITIVNGALPTGFIYGALMAAGGVTVAGLAPNWLQKSNRILLRARYRRSKEEASMVFSTILATTILKALQAAGEADGDE